MPVLSLCRPRTATRFVRIVRDMAQSAAAAAIARYESIPAAVFPAAVRPPIYFDLVPVADGGQPVRPPYVVVTDRGQRLESIAPDAGTIERATIEVAVYAMSLAAVDDLVMAIRHGGAPPAARAGLDAATWPSTAPYECVLVQRVAEVRRYAGWSVAATPVYMATLTYDVTWGLRGS